jgi:hypothetical protein
MTKSVPRNPMLPRTPSALSRLPKAPRSDGTPEAFPVSPTERGLR